MGKAVIELQKEIINNKSDVISILRKAHLIASKLNLNDFDRWITQELNGYDKYEDIPEYRIVIGEIKAKNSYYGLIPVMISSDMAKTLNQRKLFNPISEIVELSKKQTSCTMSLPAEISEALCANEGITFPCYFIFGVHYLQSIIDSVKNEILEWSIKLENNKILGDEFQFSDDEKEKAKSINQQINYYGNVINGNITESQVVSGNNNEINFDSIIKDISDIEKSITNEKIDQTVIDDVLEILEDIRDKVNAKKKKSIIKSSLIGLKDFLVNCGAGITVALLQSKFPQLFV